ncbi:MAG: adenylate/guanylate cyclase domain-containing protein [Chloroflexota bacterium]
MIEAELRHLGARLVAAASDPTATGSENTRRATLVMASITVGLLSFAWVAVYLALGHPIAAAIPFAYQVASLVGLLIVARGQGFAIFRASQLGLMAVLPFLLQWVLGGYAASSAVSLWSLVSALGAVFFLGAVAAVPWFVGVVALTILSAILDPLLAASAVAPPALIQTAFFGLNVLGVSATAYVMVQFFVRQREGALEALDREHQRSETLLLNVLPQVIAERLKAGATTIADAHPEVTVLFADVVDFTPYAERTSAEQVVNALDVIFTAFDEIADRHHLEKIKTIGDAYLLVGGLPEPRADHARAVALAALELLETNDRLAESSGTGLRIRIGMDSGPVIAGVIGRRKFSYDLWGDTVNTAARMESHGAAGRIQVTGRVEARLRDEFDFEPRGTINLKGKSATLAFFLVGPRDA